ncbi:MAG: capsule assembly Wzi family protein [Myxococcales bacterium]
MRAVAADEHDRPYSLPARPRALAGEIAASCEYEEGRPCGDGAGLGAEVDSRAGLGSALTAATRVRLWGGTDRFGHNLELDRAVLAARFGPLGLQVGRDVLTLGPAVRGGLMVSSNAAPQDGFRAELRPVAVTSWLKINFFYFLDRLRDPQTFGGTLLDCTRAQLDFFDRVQIGGSRLLQFGGDGAPDIGGLWGFLGEHFGRSSANSAGAENNRVSFDLAVRLGTLRAYYEIAFEDTRHRFWNMLQYDADHLLGVEVRGPVPVVVELSHTGWVSQEHSVFRTGMTNAGRTLGSAMGPDGTSLWVRADVPLGKARLSPWAEWMRFVSDSYGSDEQRGVFVIATGPMEHRQRLGADLEARLSAQWTLTAGAFGERIGNADLVPGATRYSAGARTALTFTP